MSAAALRILLVLKHDGYVGVYEALVRELAARGHHVHVAFYSGTDAGVAAIERLSAGDTVSASPAPRRAALDGWSSVAWLARSLGDLGRYADPAFADAEALRARMGAKVQSHLVNAAGFDPVTRRLALRWARRLQRRTDTATARNAIRRSARLESAVPAGGRARRFVREHRPDVVLVSPLIELASPLLEYLKAARQLGVPTGICVASWDNLTSKGLLRFVPERVFVWNDTQRREATELHGIPADRVVATGAARFDEWFDQQPSTPREAFVRSVGLDPSRPYLLYLCSSAFVAPDEVDAVSRWLAALRACADERLRGAGVLIRPHPKRTEPWRNADLSRFGNATVWHGDVRPGPEGVRAGFYDSIAHSAAVVGANTSAMLEAAIVGKQVFAYVSPEFAQEGTLHFRYLLEENGGFLHVAGSLDEHLAQLAEGLGGGEARAGRVRAFVDSFLRPAGADVRATSVYADAVEELAEIPVVRRRDTDVPLRVALTPLAAVSSAALAVRVGRAAVASRLPRSRRRAAGKARVGTVRA
ncbi:MAG TPA: hypothetical protein VFA66_02210 [Gaiellaceae bacterium]|nr:hypothetical protein [Gaiellaceae bacterium]